MPIERQMDRYERSKWYLWIMSMLAQSLFLWATQTTRSGSSVIWATGTIATVLVLIAVLIAKCEHWPLTREMLVNMFFVSVVPLSTLVMLASNDVAWTVSWAALEGLGAALMASWAVFDIVALKQASTTVSFEDVVEDAKRNAR